MGSKDRDRRLHQKARCMAARPSFYSIRTRGSGTRALSAVSSWADSLGLSPRGRPSMSTLLLSFFASWKSRAPPRAELSRSYVTNPDSLTSGSVLVSKFGKKTPARTARHFGFPAEQMSAVAAIHLAEPDASARTGLFRARKALISRSIAIRVSDCDSQWSSPSSSTNSTRRFARLSARAMREL